MTKSFIGLIIIPILTSPHLNVVRLFYALLQGLPKEREIKLKAYSHRKMLVIYPILIFISSTYIKLSIFNLIITKCYLDICCILVLILVHKFPLQLVTNLLIFPKYCFMSIKKSCSLSISSKLFTWLLKQSKCVWRTCKTLNL